MDDVILDCEALTEEHIRLIQDKHTQWNELNVVAFAMEIQQITQQQAIKAMGRPVGWRDKRGCLHSEVMVKTLSTRVMDMDAVYAVKQLKPLRLPSVFDELDEFDDHPPQSSDPY